MSNSQKDKRGGHGNGSHKYCKYYSNTNYNCVARRGNTICDCCTARNMSMAKLKKISYKAIRGEKNRRSISEDLVHSRS